MAWGSQQPVGLLIYVTHRQTDKVVLAVTSSPACRLCGTFLGIRRLHTLSLFRTRKNVRAKKHLL